MGTVARTAVGLVAAGALLGASKAAAALRFRVTYVGSGSYRTVYRSEPANPGGNPDHNYANDSSRQRWSLTFTRRLVLARPGSLTGARGPTSITARIDHVHVDGLYPVYNQSVRCRLQSVTARGGQAPVTLDVHRTGAQMAVTVTDPLIRALVLLPPECPGQGDPIDGLNDNYLQPGFSFVPGYGPDRWFRSATVMVPLRALRTRSRVSIRVHDTSAGRPPEHCAVPHPSYEQCQTGGRWSGKLVLTRIG